MPSELRPSGVPATSRPTRACRVLVVDDDFDSAEVLGLVLADEGYEVKVALRALEAIEVVSEFTPHFAIVDIGMPEINGYELVAMLRGLPSLVDCRYVALSGHPAEGLSKQSQVAGFERHLNKPVTIKEVLDALETPRASVAS